MSYNPQNEVDNLGPNATEDNFRGLYNAILCHWFPSSHGYIVGRQALVPQGKLEYLAGGFRNTIFVAKLKSPSNWGETGRDEVMLQLTRYIEGQFDLTQYEMIYGLGGIGTHWVVCKMQRSGERQPSLVSDWHDDITSDASYAKFKVVADLVYSIG